MYINAKVGNIAIPKRNLQWYGSVPTANKKSRIRRCILEFTSETTENYNIFGISLTDSSENDTTVNFKYGQRMFLAIFRKEFVIVCEDCTLNIKVLIDLWDRPPLDYTEMNFGNEFELYITNF